MKKMIESWSSVGNFERGESRDSEIISVPLPWTAGFEVRSHLGRVGWSRVVSWCVEVIPRDFFIVRRYLWLIDFQDGSEAGERNVDYECYERIQPCAWR